MRGDAMTQGSESFNDGANHCDPAKHQAQTPSWWQIRLWTGWRMPLLSWGLAFFSYIFFPIYLLSCGFESVLELRRQNTRNRLARMLDSSLDQLETLKDDRYFFHTVLQNVFSRAEKSDKPAQTLKNSIAQLRQKFPGMLRFTVWDGNGNLLPELCDGKGYKYIRRLVWKLLKAVEENARSENPVDVQELQEFRACFRLVQPFLGNTLVPFHLEFPFGNKREPNIIMGDYRSSKSYFWYHIGEKIGFLCFINRDIVTGETGLRTMVRELNQHSQKQGIVCGYAYFSDLEHPFTASASLPLHDLLMAFGTYENCSEIGRAHV